MPDAKMDALLETVRRHRDEQCNVINEDAQAQARAIVARAHQDARTKVHGAIVEERRSREDAIEKQHARVETAKRHDRQDNENAFLDTVWQQLMANLHSRWEDESARRAWLNATVERALAHLHPGPWQIDHPMAWQSAELDSLIDQIIKFSGEAPSFVPVPDLEVGIRVTANGATIDGSLVGVIANRGEISAMLLAQLLRDAEDTS